MAKTKRERASYHHGDLRRELIEATLEIVGESGVRGFSVAEAARRTGVSSGAPFRHFADRDALLAAAGVAAFDHLQRAYERAVDPAADAAGQLAAFNVAFVTVALESPGAFELLSGAGFDAAGHVEFQEARRRVIDLRVPLGIELAADHESALALVGALYALANGFALLAGRNPAPRYDGRATDFTERSRRAALATIAGWDARAAGGTG
jgi:AcrR family transcriptional regulator